MNWRRLNGMQLDLPIREEVEKTIKEEIEKGFRLKVCIGTDSRVKVDSIEFATVIVFLREHRGGFMFISNFNQKGQMSVKERMINEVARSVEVAYNLCELFDRYNVELEIHADINTDPGFQSNSALRDAMGYVMSMGFVFKAKPDAFASSCCADKMV
ncbi:MAG: hypothetical protein EA411_02725 [Saprospirales bacterium]|nr:MAG: hypothetical protein EA411_02725 [Saprospirales bacterium]